LALTCPTKLFYVNKPEYNNLQIEDAFLEALKDGGYQVGALAQAYIEGGVNLAGYDNDEAYQKTQALLKEKNIIIYEALFRYKNMQVRCDILIKKGEHIEVIEVKSKSYAEAEDSLFRDENGNIGEFRNKKGTLIGKWTEHLLDIAFQSYVIEHAFSQYSKITYSLMLVDKNKICPVNGLNQKFLLKKHAKNLQPQIITKPLTTEDKTPWLLIKINVVRQINELKANNYIFDNEEMGFEDYVKKLAYSYVNNYKITSQLGGKCKNCEFYASANEQAKGLKSGFKECWQQVLKWEAHDFESKTVLNLWNSRASDKWIAQGKVKLDDLSVDDLNVKEENDYLSQSARQWMQIEKYQTGNERIFVHPMLKKIISTWIFPLHFIDFETCTVALPFHKGHKPYEPIAFQYSHHIVHQDGKIEHKSEYIAPQVGIFPNYDFVRALKKDLEQDRGTIFRFHNHENTILNTIYQQLEQENDLVEDKEVLMTFIASITIKKEDNKILRQGERCMIDLEEILRKYTYFPGTDGRTSMKVVFPAVLNLSNRLQQKYSQPIYGASGGIKSQNFQNWSVVEIDENGKVINPYLRLPNVYDNIPKEDIALLEKAERTQEIKEIREGGMASTAYALMQFSELSDIERLALKQALLKYCELDTLAMVILYEFLREIE